MTGWWRLQLAMWRLLIRTGSRVGGALLQAAQDRHTALACPQCSGVGAVRDSTGAWWTCPTCHGRRRLGPGA